MKTNWLLIPIWCIVFLLLLPVVGCKDNNNASFTDKPVIEAYLHPGNKIRVKITGLVPYDGNSESLAAKGLENVHLKWESKDVLLKRESGDYYCPTDTSLEVLENTRYFLDFRYGDKIIKANTSAPAKPLNFKAAATSVKVASFNSSNFSGGIPSFPDPIKLTWDAESGGYYVIKVECIEKNPTPINSSTSSDTANRPVIRESPSQSSSYELQPIRLSYFGKHHIILMRVLPEILSIYDNTGNSNSSTSLKNPGSNVENGYGIFTAINSDTLPLQVNKK